MVSLKQAVMGVSFLTGAALLAFAAAPQGPKPNFSGEWYFVPTKSKLQIPAPASGTFRIEHREPAIKIARTFIREGKSDTWGIEMTTDGKEVVQEGNGQTSRARLYWEGSDLVLDEKITLKDRQATNVVKYHLSNGDKTLTASESFHGPILKYDNTWVFEKK